jgi:hypothetical protein
VLDLDLSNWLALPMGLEPRQNRLSMLFRAEVERSGVTLGRAVQVLSAAELQATKDLQLNTNSSGTGCLRRCGFPCCAGGLKAHVTVRSYVEGNR